MFSAYDVFSIQSAADFEQQAMNLFRHQAANNAVYAEYIRYLGRKPEQVEHTSQIPFLPVSLFKTHKVLTGSAAPEIVFTSSGTTGMQTSRHLVPELKLYEASFVRAFELFYGSITNYTVLALLPSYLEREGSSLIYMAEYLIKASNKAESGFYLYNRAELAQMLQRLDGEGNPVLLLGVSFALLDLVAEHRLQLKHTVVMETGGMKGRGKELTRQELHERLCNGLGVQAVHSEYGMTELLSQAYSTGNMRYQCPPWMQIRLRDTYDPFGAVGSLQTGGVNIIDLANSYSCAFIETQDLGKIHPDGSFEILGRFDHSDLRGCNLLIV